MELISEICHAVLAAVIFTAISCACDSFVCSLVVAISERAIFQTKTASMAFLAGSRGQITPIFKAWIQYHQNYLLLVINLFKDEIEIFHILGQ